MLYFLLGTWTHLSVCYALEGGISLSIQAEVKEVPEVAILDVGEVQEDDGAQNVDSCYAECSRNALCHVPSIRHVRAMDLQPRFEVVVSLL